MYTVGPCEDPQRIRVASVFEPLVCLIVLCLSANFLIFLLLILLSVVLSPLLFIYNIIAVMIDIDTS